MPKKVLLMNLADVLIVVQPRRPKPGLAVAASEISKEKCFQQLVPLAEKKLPYHFNQPETNLCIAETATNPNNAAIGKNKDLPGYLFPGRFLFTINYMMTNPELSVKVL
jgi:hypothetical protein